VSEQPVEQPVQRSTPEMWAPPLDSNGQPVPFAFPTRRPSVVVKADLLPAISVASTAALVGLPLAWIWSRIAPVIPGALNSAGKPVPLPSPYGYHRFDDLAIFMLMGLGAGLATGVAMWMLRSRRGPVILVAGVLGALIGGWLAMHTGVSFAAGHYALTTAPQAGSVFAIAPRLETGWVVVVQPLGAALAYGVLAAWNGTNDLGRRIG
jgi:xanthosine utilization system XapX-like protein